MMSREERELEELFKKMFCVTNNTFENIAKANEKISDAVKIVMLENKKKHCKNYLENKQTDRELNRIKFRKGKKHGS